MTVVKRSVSIDAEIAAAATVGAPPVYAPPGPILFLPEVADPCQAITAAVEEAARRGCAGGVVDHHPGDDALEAALIGAFEHRETSRSSWYRRCWRSPR